MTTQLDAALAGPDGAVHPQLTTLRDLLLTDYTPIQIQDRCDHSEWVQLAGDLAAAGGDITHADLDALPPQNHVRLLRHMLVATEALEPRSVLTDMVDSWLHHFLAGQRPEVSALLRPYAAWSVLRRARHRHARGLDSPSSPKYVRTRITLAAQFLTWLGTREVSLFDATQSDVDLWLSQGASTRHRVRDFLQWAYTAGHTTDLTAPWLGREGLPSRVLADDTRWALLRRCVHENTVALELRVAGALVLLYGHISTRIVELTRDDITSDGQHRFRHSPHGRCCCRPPWRTSSTNSPNNIRKPHPTGNHGCSPASAEEAIATPAD